MPSPWSRPARTREVVQAARAVADGREDVVVPRHEGLPAAVAGLADAVSVLADRARMLQAENVALLTELADELRTPLASLDAWLDALGEGRVAPDDASLGAMRVQTQALRVVVSDMGDAVLAGGGPVQLELAVLPLGPIVVTACRLFRQQAMDRGVRLSGVLDDDLPDVLIDPDRVVDVLARLLDNAVRHTPPHGEIVASARRCDAGVVLAVTDTGDGLREDVLPRLFDRFYRVEGAREHGRRGRGLGLAVAKALVEAHGGRISASSPGLRLGSSFDVELPAHVRVERASDLDAAGQLADTTS